MTKAVIIQVGGGPCEFYELSAVVEFYLLETTFICGINLLVVFRQPCVQFSLRATRPLKDHPFVTTSNKADHYGDAVPLNKVIPNTNDRKVR